MNENDYNDNVDTNDNELYEKDSSNIHSDSLNIHLNLLNIYLNLLNIHLNSLNIQEIRTKYQYLCEIANSFASEDFVVDYHH